MVIIIRLVRMAINNNWIKKKYTISKPIETLVLYEMGVIYTATP